MVGFLEQPDKLVELAGNQLGGFVDVYNRSLFLDRQPRRLIEGKGDLKVP